MKTEDLKPKMIIKTFDDEDNRWVKTEVIKITDGSIYLKDIDPDSEWEGMDWNEPIKEFNWR